MKKTSSKTASVDQGSCTYGAGVLLKHLQALEAETAGVHAGSEDIEFIHRARVASRRLRAALPLFQDCLPEKKAAAWLKQIRGVTRALGEARDTDVQLERLMKVARDLPDPSFAPGMQRLILRLRQKRRGLQEPVVRAMQQLFDSGTIQQMDERLQAMAAMADQVYIYTPALYKQSFTAITARLESFLAFDSIVEQPEKVTELHEMRISAKQLRYTMENFSAIYSDQLKPQLSVVRKAQDLLGDIHDCDVWGYFLDQFIADERALMMVYLDHARPLKRLLPGFQFFADNRRQAREKFYDEFVKCWRDWQKEDVWGQLRTTIQVPFLKIDQVFPPRAAAE